MSSTTTELPESAAAAVTEASRIAAQAARRCTETAKASIEAARTYLDDTNQVGRDLLGTWATQGEATLKAAFEAQTAAIDAGLGLFDLGLKGNRQAVEQFTTLVKQTQQATFESWQAAVKSAMKATEPVRR
jgi:pectin methylesterase-like acyl-CoA thioesterase